MPLLTGGNIVNVERVKITEEGTGGATYMFKTSTSATFTPSVSQGTEKEQRIKNTIMGLIRTEDLAKGYDIELADQRLIAEIFALMDGGTLTTGNDGWTSYSAPVAGAEVTRKTFTLELYTSDRDSEGSVNEYYKWSFPGCKGTPVSGGATDDDFQTIRYTIRSRPAAGTSPMTLTRVDTLPSAS